MTIKEDLSSLYGQVGSSQVWVWRHCWLSGWIVESREFGKSKFENKTKGQRAYSEGKASFWKSHTERVKQWYSNWRYQRKLAGTNDWIAVGLSNSLNLWNVDTECFLWRASDSWMGRKLLKVPSQSGQKCWCCLLTYF